MNSLSRATATSLWLCLVALPCLAFVQPVRPSLPEIDVRAASPPLLDPVTDSQRAALYELRAQLPQLQVDFDPLTGAPKLISAREQFLTGQNGLGKTLSGSSLSKFASDPYRVTKAFLDDHAALFGFGSDALATARISREFVTPPNGMRSVVWQQQVDSVPVFEALLLSHLTAAGELVNISSMFLPDPFGAATLGVGNPTALVANPPISAAQAVALAARSIGEDCPDDSVIPEPEAPAADFPNRLQFRAANLLETAAADMLWFPLSKDRLRLCWDIHLTGKSRSELYRVLLDAQNGQVLLRRCLTEYLTDASYRVYTNDSPTPFSPGFSTPVTNQPALVARALVTLPAFDTNASPAGWIDDTNNETLGNNVDAHLDRDANNQPDLPRPSGSPSRVFDISMNITKDPTNYSAAAVVQLFYLCNWMHDQLYGLGFTEAAGNFQTDNFGRGGFGNDAVRADAQDGSGFNNANFSAPSDGFPGRMQMYLWNSSNPRRDGDFDAEIVLHEYTHGLSNRKVGGGPGISALQTRGMGEGWSDFYALSLLSQPADDVNAVYAAAAYSGFRLAPFNYYSGIRRYPYTTDLAKNPLTLNDIDTTRADHCASGAPYNSGSAGACDLASANEVHNQGEVWCVTLWEARANLIAKYGWAIGNQLMLRLVTDGMTLSPPNPTFLQARDAILQADVVDNAGANHLELWAAFAKRGLGYSATVPANSTTVGIHESFDLQDDLQVGSNVGIISSGLVGGPFAPSCQTYSLWNTGVTTLAWTATTTQAWVTASPPAGTLAPGETNTLQVCLSVAADSLLAGNYTAGVRIANTNSGVAQFRGVSLAVTPPRILFFPLDTDPGWVRQGQWAFGPPAGLGGATHGRPDPSSGATGSNVFGYNLNGDYLLSVGVLPSSLIGGPFNFGGMTNLRLGFQRWLNCDTPPFVNATLQVSTNGSNWTPIWANGFTETADSEWTRVVYDLSAYADNQTNVFIRWGHLVGQPGAYAYSGWNIDDVEFLGNSSLDHFSFARIPTPQNLNVPFLVSVQAKNSANGPVTGFPGPVTLSATNGGILTPITLSNFVAGSWTGLVAVTRMASNIVLQVDDGNGHSGQANVFDLVSAPRLDSSFTSTNLSLAWAAGAPGLVLESTDSLSPAAWSPVTNPPVQIGDQFILQISPVDPQRFYRLRYP